MSKSTEFSRRGRNGLRTLLPAVMLLGGTSALAGGAGTYELVVQAESNQGKRLVRGLYDSAESAAARTPANTFEALNNRCVMHIVAREFTEARAACDRAVERIDLDRLGMGYPRYPVDYRPLAEERKAMALINRGVLRALTADAEGARDDFERAVELGPHIAAGEANLARLEAVGEASPAFAGLSE